MTEPTAPHGTAHFPAGPDRSAARTTRVLVVEDEPNIRELVCLHLRLEGYSCDAIGNGQEALEKTEAESYDLVDLGPAITIHGVFIDPARRRVRCDGRDIDLTDQEFRLLHLLASHAGIVFSREALLAKIWRGDTFVTVRSVDTLVKRLRRRVEPDQANPRFLITVWGVGYKFADV